MTFTTTHITALALLALAAVAVTRRDKCAGPNCGAKSQAYRAAVEPPPPGYYANGFATLAGTFADPSRFMLPDIQWQAGAVGRAARPTAQNGDAVAAGMAPPIEIFIQ